MTQGRPYSLATTVLRDKTIPPFAMIRSAQVSKGYHPKSVYGTAIIVLDLMIIKDYIFFRI